MFLAASYHVPEVFSLTLLQVHIREERGKGGRGRRREGERGIEEGRREGGRDEGRKKGWADKQGKVGCPVVVVILISS